MENWKFSPPASILRLNMPVEIITPPPSGLSKPTATAALGASRALTSHLRNFYLVCYEGKCRRPRLTFFIDMGLLVIAAILLAFIVWFVRQPVAPPGVSVSFAVPPIQSGASVPLVVKVRSADGKAHRNVRLQWRLPQGAELLETHPAFTSDFGAYLGNVEPGRDASSYVLVRFFLPPGENANFGFSVLYDDFGIEHQYTAADQRPIVGTALTADIPHEFLDADITKDGTTVPIRVVNKTDRELPSAYIVLTTDYATTTAEQRSLGNMAPQEERLIFASVKPTAGSVTLQWTAGAASRDLSAGSWTAAVVDAPPELFPTIAKPLRASPGTEIHLSVDDTRDGDALLVVHPLRSAPVERIPLTVESTTIDLSAPVSATGTNHEWFVVPVMTSTVNRPVFGPAVMGVTAVTLPFTTQIRYLSSAGDQLGAGPNPPAAGIETRYWVFWTVGPVDNALEKITVDADLPSGVTATGNVSGPEGGASSITRRHVRWTLPKIEPAEDSTSASATFGFEISVTPDESDIGEIIPLLGESAASAEDTHTFTVFEGSDTAKTSELPEDAGKERAGVIQPGPQ
jgi:hypothetical protein